MTRPAPGRRRALAHLGALSALGSIGAGLSACASRPAGSAEAASEAAPPRQTPDDTPPPAPREWRAAWVASVANIDWPRRPSPDAAALRAEAQALLDRALALGLNALILQVRPACDALYPSKLEPWSEYLSGRQGQAPSGDWDPLAFWIDAAHERGLELHAWFNPYRARHPSAKSPLSPEHIARRRPELVRQVGNQRWLDPGEPAAAAHTLAVIDDVARRYDIDGVHIDDYFYPYPATASDGSERPFPDEASWRRYRREGGRLARDDWRRNNVDRLVQALHRTVREARADLRFGISPFGIGKPTLRPPGIEGFSQYDKLYADVERWCAEGWLDYLVPQLYWPIDRRAQAFEVLLAYWRAQTAHGRHVWPGLFTDSVGRGKQPWPAEEVLAQIGLTRQAPPAGGHAHFSMTVLMEDRAGLAGRLAAEAYAEPALSPACPWLGGQPPAPPRLLDEAGGWRLVPGEGSTVWRWAIWRRRSGRWRFEVQPAAQTRVEGPAEALVVSAVCRRGHESERVSLRAAG